MPKKKQPKKPVQHKPSQDKPRNVPLHIPLPFEQAVEALLKVKPKKKNQGEKN
jgi:hypothetical protein